jgi:DNA-binding NtrC family response regulator
VRQFRGPMDQRVLLVEDESRLRDMLLRALREMGMEPAGAESAEQAMRVMEQRAYPVLIIDLNLPGAGGLDLLRAVRERWPGVQAIILTGFGDLDAAREAIRLDVADFLTKPCSLGDLEIALGRTFRRVNQDMLPTPDPDQTRPKPETGTRQNQEPAEPSASASPPAPNTTETLSLEDIERQTILRVLERNRGNRAAAAAELGISVRKLYYRISQYQSRGSGT